METGHGWPADSFLNWKKFLNEAWWTKYLLHHYKEENREIS